MVSNSLHDEGFGRRIFDKKEILEGNDLEIEENEEEDVMKDIPDYKRSNNKRQELQHFFNDFNSLVINEKSGSKSKEEL